MDVDGAAVEELGGEMLDECVIVEDTGEVEEDE